MNRGWLPLVLLAMLVVLATSLFLYRPSPEPQTPSLSVGRALGGEAEAQEGYARATEHRAFRFPEDHGPHPDYRNEWWYITGNLDAPQRRPFGFQLTLFRIALASELQMAEPTPSAWRSRQVYMGHLALTDVEDERFFSEERFARGAAGLAGAQTSPLRVWLEEWRIEAPGPSTFPLHLQAGGDGFRIDLQLERGKPVVLQGDRGLSQKSAEPGNASYYYSLTRMPAAGEITIGEERWPVRGQAWLDREWSTSALGPDQVGWDWFALQFADGRELMFYRLRLRDGATDPLSAGTLVGPEGDVTRLTADEVSIAELAHWESPRSGIRYPSRWRLRIPKAGLSLEVRPRIPDQELDHTVTYWEGAVQVDGTAAGRSIAGRGYVELTGYDSAPERKKGVGVIFGHE